VLKRIVFPMLVVVAVIALTMFVCAVTPWMYIDIASFILVPIGSLLFMGLAFGWKASGAAFSSAWRPNASRRELEASVRFFKGLRAVVWSFGALGAMIGLIAVLSNLTDRARVGPNLAVALVSVLYAAIFDLLAALPFLSVSTKRLAEAD